MYKIPRTCRGIWKRGGIDRLFLYYMRLTRCPRREPLDFWTKSRHKGGLQASRIRNRGTCLGFCFACYRTFSVNAGFRRPRPPARGAPARRNCRDARPASPVPQREPRRRIGGQQVVQRVQIAAVVGRKANTLASTSCSCSRVYSVSASKSSSFILISPKLNYCKSYSVISSKLS